jgi:hypothetical protein
MANQHKHPAIHNAMWPGLVGKGPGSEPFIGLETMLDLTAARPRWTASGSMASICSCLAAHQHRLDR